jgi:hypothetical protein
MRLRGKSHEQEVPKDDGSYLERLRNAHPMHEVESGQTAEDRHTYDETSVFAQPLHDSPQAPHHRKEPHGPTNATAQ